MRRGFEQIQHFTRGGALDVPRATDPGRAGQDGTTIYVEMVLLERIEL
ncbi:hypothetical protein [Marivita sp. S6314]|nr:hypothetical protein [Marivita sp. S6314]